MYNLKPLLATLEIDTVIILTYRGENESEQDV